MPNFTPKFRPGINKLDTGLANEGGYVSGNRCRFHQGQVQPIGGWTLHTVTQFEGKARGSKSWRTLEGKLALAWGTASKLYAEVAGSRSDITPNMHETTILDVFTTVSGSPIVTVEFPFHRLKAGETIVFSNHQSTIGGLTIEGSYTVTEVLTSGRFTITHGSNAASTVTTPGGGYVDVVAALPAGLDTSPLSGFGAGEWSEGSWGGSSDSGSPLRVWTLDIWGEYLLANPSGYGIFEFQPELVYADLAYNGSFTGSADGWALGTGWAYGTNRANKTAGVASNLSQDVEGVLEGGRYYIVTFDINRTAGSIRFRANAGDPAAVIDVAAASSPITKSGSYSRLFLCPADPLDVVFDADATFAGYVDNVTYQLIDRAYRIVTAPARVDAMFVDPRGLVVALGTSLVDGSYSATGLRCSDIGNNRSWIPDTGSLASEDVLRGGGGRLMSGLATRQQNLVWGDEGVFSLQYQGTEGAAFEPQLLGTGCGIISRHAMAEQNGFVFWVSNTRQFFIFRGLGATSLGIPELMPSPVGDDLFSNLNYNQSLKIHAGINAAFSEFWLFYPDARDGDECSRAVTCAWTQGTEQGGIPWSTHMIERTSWVNTGTFPFPIAFSPELLIFKHEVGQTANGAALGERIRTAPFDMGEGDTLLDISTIRPQFSQQTGNVDIYLHFKFESNGDEITAGPFKATPTTKKLFPRISASEVSVEYVGATSGGFWRTGAIRFEMGDSQVEQR